MGWKLYFAFYAALSVFGWADAVLHPADQPLIGWVQMPFEVAVLVGLFGFAFGLRLGTALLWKAVALASACLLLISLIIMLPAFVARLEPAIPIWTVVLAGAFAVAVLLALTVPPIVALFSYSKRLSGAEPAAA